MESYMLDRPYTVNAEQLARRAKYLYISPSDIEDEHLPPSLTGVQELVQILGA